MQQHNTIEILRNSIARWVADAEAALQEAAHERREAVAFGQRFEDICKTLPTAQCPFCGGQMLDTGPLQEFADELAHARQWLFQGELFRLHCLACGTYRADPPRASAQIWEAGETAVRGKTFAAALFRTFPNISVVALEGATGRGWVIRLDNVWYANGKTKDDLTDLWGIA